MHQRIESPTRPLLHVVNSLDLQGGGVAGDVRQMAESISEQGVPHLVTCHDVLDLRSARGDFPENGTRSSGRFYQWFIREGLRSSVWIVCVSEATRTQWRDFADDSDTRVIDAYRALYAEIMAQGSPPASADGGTAKPKMAITSGA